IGDITFDQRTTADQRSRSDQRTDTALSDTRRGAKPSLDSTTRPANPKGGPIPGRQAVVWQASFARPHAVLNCGFHQCRFYFCLAILWRRRQGEHSELGPAARLGAVAAHAQAAARYRACRARSTFFRRAAAAAHAISLGLAALRQSVDRLAVGLEQIARAQ